jgi:hypothetical protein
MFKNMIIINTNQYNGFQKGVNTFFATPIKSGEHIGKFATSENALLEFPEIFETLTYEVVDLDASAFEIDYTPPPLSPYAVVIPEIYQWAFPENKFVLSGFEIPLDTYNNDKVVNLAYFMWSEFRAELDSGNYEDLKRALMPLWDYVELQVINNNLVIL